MLLAVWFVAVFSVDVPFADDWEIVPVLAKLKENRADWHDFDIQHTDSRVLVSRSTQIAAAAMARGDMRAVMFVSLGFLVGTVIVLYRFFRELPGSQSMNGIWFFPVSALFLTWRQWEGLLWGTHIANSTVLFFLTLALYLCLRAVQRPILLAGAIAAGVLASYSMVTGLLIWPLGLLWLFAARDLDARGRLRLLTAWSIAACITIAAYFRHYMLQKPPWPTGPVYLLQHVYEAVMFICIYLGSPLASSAPIAQSIGALLLLFAAVALWFTVRDSAAWRWAPPFWLLLMFVAGLSVLAAAGRMGLGVDQAFLASRYVTASSMAALAVYLLLLGARERSRFSRMVFRAYVVFMSAGISAGYYSGWKSGIEDHYKKSLCWQTVRCYAQSESRALSTVYAAGFMLRVWAPLLETHRLSLFQEDANPCNPSTKKLALYILDMLGPVPNPEERKEIILPAGRPWTAYGWALDATSARPALGVHILIGNRSFPMKYGVHRLNLAQVFKFPMSEHVGFEGIIPAGGVPKGRHEVTVRVFNRQGTYEDGRPFTVDVQ